MLSIWIHEHIIVVRRNSPVLTVIVFLREIFLVICKEGVQLNALFEILNGFCASNLFKEIEVAVYIDTGSDKSMPMHTLNLDVGIILLELEVYCFIEVYVRSLNCVHVASCHLKLVEIKVFWEHLHLQYLLYY